MNQNTVLVTRTHLKPIATLIQVFTGYLFFIIILAAVLHLFAPTTSYARAFIDGEYFSRWWLLLACMLFVGFFSLLSYFRERTTSVSLVNGELVYQCGNLNTYYDVIPVTNFHHHEITQSFFQKPFNVSDLTLYTSHSTGASVCISNVNQSGIESVLSELKTGDNNVE